MVVSDELVTLRVLLWNQNCWY